MLEPVRPRMTIHNMAHSHCILDNKATATRSEYLLVLAFPLQYWLREQKITRSLQYIL